MRVYRVPEEEQAKVLAFIGSIDIRELAVTVMHKLFAMLEMKYDFKLSTDGETEGEKMRTGKNCSQVCFWCFSLFLSPDAAKR